MWHESKCQHLEVGGPIPTSSLHIGTQYAKGRGGSRAFNPSIEMKNNPLRSLQARKKSKNKMRGNVVSSVELHCLHLITHPTLTIHMKKEHYEELVNYKKEQNKKH